MADGKSNAEIGRELFVSEDTVKTHARRLFRKLGARDRAHAVAAGFRAGLVACQAIATPPLAIAAGESRQLRRRAVACVQLSRGSGYAVGPAGRIGGDPGSSVSSSVPSVRVSCTPSA